MFDSIVKVSGDPNWVNNTTTITLKLDFRFFPTGAMGIWDIARGTNDHGNGGENTSHARWFKDKYEKTVNLKIGWYDGDTRIIEVFTLFQIDELTKVGEYGGGKFYFGGQRTETNIEWEVIRLSPPSERPKL